MNIKPIKTKKDYRETIARVEKLWDAELGTKRSDELEILTIMVEKYENDNYNILPPDPVEAIKFRMEQTGMMQKDLGEIIGENRASEILKKKRGLTLGMIRALHANMHIPTDSLIG